jgi:hypothetical protein
MLIEKGGISRQIDEKNLQRYKGKGYQVTEKELPEPEKEPPKPKK